MRLPVLGLTLAATVFAQQQPNTLTSDEKKLGWALLFDGKSTKGWTKAGTDAWTVENGCLKSLSNPKIREDLLTTATFGDFVLTFEWKVAPGSNSGVKYKIQDSVLIDAAQLPNPKMPFEQQVAYELQHHSARVDKVKAGSGAQVYPVAFEYQVIDNQRHPDALHSPLSRAASLYRMAAATKDATKPVGEFNQAKIVVRGKHVEHWLNGVKVVDTDLDTADVRKHIEERWPAGHPVRELLEKMPKQTTPLALQHHNDVAWFRNIKIRRLPPPN
ncbi:DUF1080 domain-containing protein [uncultured Paludibaculum sp.]|uniref:3-keto-disaccharide hydrolase n=1 Tax=uncultured Paludibaculum sp. TaxID=1765020 RepID=UPI002AAAE35B|nr:DUF1080 domain-containing protein [uncultured Paludibaculum sp.]